MNEPNTALLLLSYQSRLMFFEIRLLLKLEYNVIFYSLIFVRYSRRPASGCITEEDLFCHDVKAHQLCSSQFDCVEETLNTGVAQKQSDDAWVLQRLCASYGIHQVPVVQGVREGIASEVRLLSVYLPSLLYLIHIIMGNF